MFHDATIGVDGIVESWGCSWWIGRVHRLGGELKVTIFSVEVFWCSEV